MNPPIIMVGCEPISMLFMPLVFVCGVGVGMAVAGWVVWRKAKEPENA